MPKSTYILLCGVFYCSSAFSQQFEMIPADFIYSENKPLKFGNILCATKGSVLIASSIGLAEKDGMNIEVLMPQGAIPSYRGKKDFLGKKSNIYKDLYESFAGIKLICEGPERAIYVVSNYNNFGCFDYKLGKVVMFPPFNFPLNENQQAEIREIWMDREGDLFVATHGDTLYLIEQASKILKPNTGNKYIPTYKWALDKDSNMVVTEGARNIKKISLGPGIIPYSFNQDPGSEIIFAGTNKGLYGFDKRKGQSINYFRPGENDQLTITHLESSKLGLTIWFSTLEKGMGKYNFMNKTLHFFPCPKNSMSNRDSLCSIQTFSRKSANEFFIAMADTLPAIFNTETGRYSFINDSLFSKTVNHTTDIKADAFGNLYVTKGGGFFWSKNYLENESPVGIIDSSFYGPFITDIMLDGIRYDNKKEFFGRDELLKEIDLKYNENNIQIFYSCRGLSYDSLLFTWKLENFNDGWVNMPFSIIEDGMNAASFSDLRPGKYVFHLKVRKGNEDWLSRQVRLTIIINPPFWQTWWFWPSIAAGISLIIFTIARWRVKLVKKQERIKSKYEKEALELEAKALRAQMNPHFIFNCMNSIKSLIQRKEEDNAVNYLTTFSKLLRTVLQNCDKREITLFDELETSRLYTLLESMRFGTKLSYNFTIDETIDLKSVTVPALIVQPFIENAIWHGIMPREEGGILHVFVEKKDSSIICGIEDNGIGREMSKQNKFSGVSSTHQSKGVHLTQSRLDLDNLLNERNATVKIIDKKDERGNPTGTIVILTFKEY